MLSIMNVATYTASMAEMRIRNIPENLHKRFKMLCVDEGISINEKVIRLVKEAVDKWESKG
jgi:plasmid stability protein